MPQRVIVVGATKGIGLAIAEALEAQDARVVRMARHDAEIPLDLAWDTAPIENAVQAAIQRLGGGLDALVLSAGMAAYLWPRTGGCDRAEEMVRVNFLGRMRAFLACGRALRESAGQALWIGSSVSHFGAPGLGAYAASLAACEAYVRCEARKWAKHGVALQVLAPGWTRTPMTADMKAGFQERAAAWMPCARFLEPHEVAKRALGMLADSKPGLVDVYLGEDLIEGSEEPL